MNYIIKDLVFKKDDKLSNTVVTDIKIHNILDIKIKIYGYARTKVYDVRFISLNGYKCFNLTDDEPCSDYTKCGFESYNEAYDYANKVMKTLLNNFISSIIVDIDDYIEEIDNV